MGYVSAATLAVVGGTYLAIDGGVGATLASVGAAAGVTSGMVGTYLSDPNAGLHTYALNVGMAGGFGALNPAGALGSLGGGIGGEAIGRSLGYKTGLGYQVGDLAGGILAGR